MVQLAVGQRPPSRTRNARPRGTRLPASYVVTAIVLVGLGFRLWWLFTRTFAIENDGAEYARIAQNLVHGHGYAGLQPGPELLFPPLYPWLMAALSPVMSVEHAGRAISVIFGSALPIPVYLLGRRIFGRRAGLLAAALVALSPLLAAFSTAVLSETTYTTIQLVAAYLLLRAHDTRSVWLAALSGACWTLAALVRPEAVLMLALFTVVGVIWWLSRKAHKGRGIAVALAAFAVCCVAFLPYAVWTSHQAGQLQWSGKATATSFINQRMHEGDSYAVATSGLGPQGQTDGVLLDPTAYIRGDKGDAPLISLSDAIHSEDRAAHHIWSQFGHSMLVGAPLVAPLAIIGLLAGPWTRRRTSQRLLLVLLGAANAVVVGSIDWFQFRFILPLIPVVLIFAAQGCVRLASLTTIALRKGMRRRAPLGVLVASASALGVLVLFALPFVTSPSGQFPTLGQRTTTVGEAKVVGTWLHDHGGDGRSVMSTSATLAYYAGSVWYPMGYTNSDAAAIAYLKNTDAATIVLTETANDPYQRRWVEQGLPDPDYRLVKTFNVNGHTTVVYQRAQR